MNSEDESRASSVGGRAVGGQSASVSQPSPVIPRLHSSPGRRAWQRFRQNRPALVSAWYLAGLLFLIVAWPVSLKIAAASGVRGADFARTHEADHL